MHTFSTHRPDDRQPGTPVSLDRKLYAPHLHIHPGRKPTGGHSQADAVTHIIPGLQPTQVDKHDRPREAIARYYGLQSCLRHPTGCRPSTQSQNNLTISNLAVLHKLQHERQLRHSPHEVFMADSFLGDVTRYRTLVQLHEETQEISIPAGHWPMSPAISLAQVITPPDIPNQAPP